MGADYDPDAETLTEALYHFDESFTSKDFAFQMAVKGTTSCPKHASPRILMDLMEEGIVEAEEEDDGCMQFYLSGEYSGKDHLEEEVRDAVSEEGYWNNHLTSRAMRDAAGL